MDSLYLARKPLKGTKSHKVSIKVPKPKFAPKRKQKAEFARFLETVSESTGDLEKPVEFHKDQKPISFVKLYFETCSGNEYRYIFRKGIERTGDVPLLPHENSTRIQPILGGQHHGNGRRRGGMPYVNSEVIFELDYGKTKI